MGGWNAEGDILLFFNWHDRRVVVPSWFRILVVVGCGVGLGDAEALVARVARPRVGLAPVPRAVMMLVELTSSGPGLLA
jgi:hypothetical protein